ncbi:choice-of-anchor I family protein [Pseudoalteromonas luteoviolacea]|uniref:choice-of-anchor I family protein n=1 Tax=Pseudoalteromonas luteoviolacea TaxID=43657 RepID=UPI001F356537|nr:choice-of-anchor I family protein [Pseudoalteromonas luteoviolacea]MCF6440203.1 choice-of-anchor I family protein [Pseudoalteromonas luteoviolacea]
MKQLVIPLLISALLAGCTFDGEDGRNGVDGKNGSNGQIGETGSTGDKGDNGEPGTNGVDGAPGLDSLQQITPKLIGRAVLNAESPEGAAEIVAYHAQGQRIFALNSSSSPATIEIINIADMDPQTLTNNAEGVVTNTNLQSNASINLSEFETGDANSLAIHDNLLAVAIAKDTGQSGKIVFFDIANTPKFMKSVTVGNLPDMVTFSPDGQKVVVANEGEPKGDYSIDPEGSIAVIDINNGQISDTASILNFNQFDSQLAVLKTQGVVFANPTGRTIKGNTINTTVSMDLEPEYVTISKDSRYAYVSLQENNAIAKVDLTDNSLSIHALGFKDWGKSTLDASDKDNAINFATYPGLYGMYQPDTIAAYQWQGANFIISANEGDGREYFFDSPDEATCLAEGGLEFDNDDGCLAYTDEVRAEDLTLSNNFDYLNNDDQDIGRLKVSTVLGDSDNDNQYEALYTYGARSFSIWDHHGHRVYDSGDDIGKITAAIHGEAFNNDEDENKGDTRSDAKGAEPEALAIGQINDRTYAFIGLERMGGIMVYDVTNPFNVTMNTYMINRGLEADTQISGDLAPEGMIFIDQAQSPTGEALLIVGNEISGSVSIWSLSSQ